MKELFGENLDDVFIKDRDGAETPSGKKKSRIIRPYEKLTWELDCNIMDYQTHIHRINNSNWERAPSPQEVFSLLIDYYEGNVYGYYAVVAEDIISRRGEYLCDIYSLTGDSFDINEKISYGYYEAQNIGLIMDSDDWYDKKVNFKISMKNGKDYDISELPKEIVEYFYTRPFEQLPAEIKNYTKIHIPLPNVLHPISRADYNLFSIKIISDDVFMSRGVREK